MSDRRRFALQAVIAAAIFVFVFFLRFNTLGGSLGGFDDDHFVPFGYAKQVQAGDQPLRDFAGIGLQGVRPSLTFEVSAAVQSLLGNTLRSEALLAVTAIAASAVLAFVAGAFVAPLPVAAAAAVAGTIFATRLYSYPKVLVLGVALLLLAHFVARPDRRGLGALAVLTAVAFLFRHDYAIYVGAGVVSAVIAVGPLRRVAQHLLWYGVLTIVLLAPSLAFVQWHRGIATYVRDSRVAIAQEANRTSRRDLGFVWRDDDGRPVTMRTFFSTEQNAVEWLYYAHLVLPVIVGVTALRAAHDRWVRLRPLIVSWAAMGIVVALLMLRGNTGARFGDLAPVTSALLAVLGAWMLDLRSRPRVAIASVAIASVILAASAQSALAVGGVARDLDVSGWSHTPVSVMKQAARRWSELGALPNAYWHGVPDSPSIAAVQYLHACTSAADRILLISYQPELLPLADRRFAGGRSMVIPGILTDDDHQRQLVEQWQRQSVPIVLVEPADEHQYEIPIVHKHLVEHYADSGPIPVNGKVLHVYTDRRRTPTRTFGTPPLPCFH